MQGMRSLPHSSNMRWPDQPYNFLRRTFPELSDAGLRLLNALLTYDPDQRMTAQQALAHEYFRVSVFRPDWRRCLLASWLLH
jgi:serine/threonine protein kinase